MKRILISALVAATALTAVPATAAPWQSINQRQQNLYNRIEQGVRSGALTRNEAGNLRTRFVRLEDRERQYRRGGLTGWERRDLEQRFDALSRSIRNQKHDMQDRRY